MRFSPLLLTNRAIVFRSLRFTLLCPVLLCLSLLWLAALTPAHAQAVLPNFQSLYTNMGNTTLEDRVVVQGSDGNFYGTTPYGGPADKGTVYKMTPSGTVTTLYSFSQLDARGTNADGALPNSLLQGSDGNLYGTTYTGGNGGGTVFKMTTGGGLTVLHTFAKYSQAVGLANLDGHGPRSLIQGSDGNLYGATNDGGPGSEGTIFEITKSGTLTTLYAFTTADSGPLGYLTPRFVYQGTDGSLYVKWSSSIRKLANGTLSTIGYAAIPNASTSSLILGSDNNFYGTTGLTINSSQVILNGGVVFKMTLTGAVTTLYTFSVPSPANTNSDGSAARLVSGYASRVYLPNSLVQGSDGNLYGTTYTGGPNASGTIFKLTPSGTLTTLHSFSASTGERNTDGVSPRTLIQGSDGNLYGTTQYGGSLGLGEVFKTSSAGTFTSLASLSSPVTEGIFTRSLLMGADGNFYGITAGDNGDDAFPGTVFKMTPAGTVTTLYAFSPSSTFGNSINPDGALLVNLVQGTDGNLYGAANSGGPSGLGTIFKVTLDGQFSLLYAFNSTNPEGLGPGSLIAGRDGNLYGSTTYGPQAGSNPSLFQLTPSGALTVLHTLSALEGYSLQVTSQGIDGYLYGNSTEDGFGEHIWQATTGGGFSILDPSDVLSGDVVQGLDGKLYFSGYQNYQSGYRNGGVNQMSTSGTGIVPLCGGIFGAASAPPKIVPGSDGNIYWTDYGNGQPGYIYGSVQKVTPSGQVTVLHNFSSSGCDGAYPYTLVEGKDGNLYGATNPGAVFNQSILGEIFEISGNQMQLTDLGSLASGTNSRAYGLNDLGQVVGASQTATGDTHAFVWNPTVTNGPTGTLSDLGTLGGNESVAYAINNNAQIVGYSYDATQTQYPFLYNSGTMTNLGSLGGGAGSAYAINDNGQIAGNSTTLSGNLHAFTDDSISQTMTDLDPTLRLFSVSFQNGSYSTAYGISSGGTVAGEMDNSSGATVGFLTNGGTVNDIGIFEGISYSTETAVDNNGYTVGAGDIATGDIHAFLWDDTGATDMGSLPSVTGTYSFASGKNCQEAVGTSYTDTGSGSAGNHAFVWSGSMTDLNSVLANGSGWVLESATGVNRSNQIVGYGWVGGQEHAYLLSPSSTALINPH